jgi:L-threonylcarbamoyladenylate synthase
VRRILEIKRRPERKGLILIAADLIQLSPFVESLSPARMSDVLRTWPGPVTWLLPVRAGTPAWLTGDHDTLAVRVTAHPLAAALCRTAASALVSTSANRSGLGPARTALQVRLQLGRDVDYILPGTCGKRAQPSTIRDGRTGVIVRA